MFRKILGTLPYSRNISIRSSIGIGGTSTVASANAVRGWEKDLAACGVDIQDEFKELEESLQISPFPEYLVGNGANKIWKAAESLGIKMELIPKSIDFSLCEGCGMCNIKCPKNAKWSAVRYVQEAVDHGARLIQETTATQVITSNGKAVGVKAIGSKGKKISIGANKVILSAGAIETPIIMQNSGLDTAGRRLFCHPFHVVYGPLPMQSLGREPRSLYCKQFLDKEGFLLTDAIIFPSRRGSQERGHLGIMVKTKDDIEGEVSPAGIIKKKYSAPVLKKARKSIKIAREILIKAGVNPRDIKVRYHAALHPGGTAAIGEVVDENLETDIKNCHVSDASLLPTPAGLPPMFTIMALSKRLAKRLLEGNT